MPLLGTLGAVSSRAFGFTTAPLPPSAPTYISGGPNLGNYAQRPRVTQYATDPGTWNSTGGTITYSYQWYKGTTAISGATGTSFTIPDGTYVGSTIKVRVTATNSIGSTFQDFLGPYAVISTTPAAPTIGTATAASTTSATITYTANDNGGDTITQFLAQSSPGSIQGTVSQSGSGTITVSGLTAGQTYTFQVYAYNSSGYSDPSASSNSITLSTVALPSNTVAPAITGTAESGNTLTCSTGTWTGSPTSYAYQWQRGTTNISGATSSSFALTATDVGNTIRCVVTATNAGGSVSANSASTATVTAAPTGLYAFTTATFTQGGAYGQFGPTLTQARNGVTAASGTSWVSNTAYLNTTGTQGGIIQWTVPITGSYRFDVYGAQGGQDGTAMVAGYPGARVQGDYYLTQGQIVNLVVGQQGRAYNSGTDGNGTGWGGTTWGGGGGGGSFVWLNGSTSAPLFVAGGGGGGGTSGGANGGQTTTSGGAGGNSGAAGGTGGYSGASSVCGGGNGQGWFGGTTSGCGGSTVWAAVYTDPTGAAGASGGQAIGAGGSYAAGGFGGGQGAYGGSGGGGGYSGGGSGGWYPAGGGGGGGSYNAGSNQAMTAATRNGNGQIIITKL